LQSLARELVDLNIDEIILSEQLPQAESMMLRHFTVQSKAQCIYFSP